MPAEGTPPNKPLLIDKFLDDAIELDVDARYDGDELFIGGIMEHIEEAGVHSGDSACVLPPVTISHRELGRIPGSIEGPARRAVVRGLNDHAVGPAPSSHYGPAA